MNIMTTLKEKPKVGNEIEDDRKADGATGR